MDERALDMTIKCQTSDRQIVDSIRKRFRGNREKRSIREWRPQRRSTYSKIHCIWRHKSDNTCFILGGGPSIKDVDISLLNGRSVIAVNNAYKLAYFSEVLFFGSCWWFEEHRKALESFPGLIVTTCQYEINTPNRVLHVRQRLNEFGLSNSPEYLTWNLNSGSCAVNLAIHLGAKRIVLLGYDMRQVDGRNNWHNDHDTSQDSNHNPYREFLLAWPYISRDAKKMNVQIINATPESDLTLFPIVEPNKFIRNGCNAKNSKCIEVRR